MIQLLSEYVVNCLVKKEAICESEKKKYFYGCDVIIYTILSTFGLLLFGCIMGRALESLVCIIVFYTNQSSGGGFHASSHNKCFLTMIAGLSIYILLLSIDMNLLFIIITGIFSLCILFSFPLVLHARKQYLMKFKDNLIKHSKKVVIFEIIIYAILFLFSLSHLLKIYTISLWISAISRISAVVITCIR